MRKYLSLLSFIVIVSCSSPAIHSFPATVTEAGSETPQVTAHGYKLLYSFKGLPDGAWPVGGLTYFKGELYGVTSWGGAVSKGTGEQTGTVFKITPDGQEKVVYVFKGYPDADSPRNAPIAVNGTVRHDAVWRQTELRNDLQAHRFRNGNRSVPLHCGR